MIQKRFGQSVIEMLVIFAVTGMLLSMVLTFNRTAKNQNDFYQFADKFVLDVRKIQDLAYLSQEYNGSDATYQGKIPCGYGIDFEMTSKKQYTVFAAFSADCATVQAGGFTAVPLFQEKTPDAVTFSAVTSDPIIFVPPYPRTMFFPVAEIGTVTIGFNGVSRDILINKAGQITK